MVFHVNPKTGNAGKCSAKKGKCPFGADAPHFDTKADAQTHWEATQNHLVIKTVSKKTLVLSDIDGTLVKSSLVLENAVELHEKGHIDLGDIPARWKEDMKNEDLIRELAESYRDALAGRHLRFARANQTIRRLMASDDNFYSTLNKLIEHKKNGAEVVLISGSPDYLVGPFAKQFGFKFHASKYHRDEKGNFTGGITLMAGAKAKQEVIETLKTNEYDEVIGLGDTASDGPLLAASHRSVLVDPTEETLETFKAQKIRIDEILRD